MRHMEKRVSELEQRDGSRATGKIVVITQGEEVPADADMVIELVPVQPPRRSADPIGRLLS